MQKELYTYEEFNKDIEALTGKIAEFSPDALLAIARGGLTIGHFLAENLETRDIFALNAISYDDTHKLDSVKIFNIPDLSDKKRVLILDDISDSGDTLDEVLKILTTKYPKTTFKTATIFYKERTKIIPDYYIKKTDKWIVFFWDKEGQRRING